MTRVVSSLFIACSAVLLSAQACQLCAATPQRLSEQFVPQSNMPQETTASLGKSKNAVIHQWGVISVNAAGGRIGPIIDSSKLPDFVHTTATVAVNNGPRLEFSALYVHPPMMMHAPLSLDIETGIRDGSISAWYPYASQIDNPNPRIPDSFNSQVTWKNVLVGVQADTLKTTSTTWMLPRSVEAPATLKVYKPGPSGTQRDDPETTEGEVFLFMAGELSDRNIHAVNSASSMRTSLTLTSDSLSPEANNMQSADPVHGWIIAPTNNADPKGSYRFTEIRSQPATETIVLQAPSGLQSTSSDTVHAKLNEAFVGNGLDADEADALTRTILRMSAGRHHGVIILPRPWVESVIPLEINGSPTQFPVRVFIAISEFPRAYFPTIESKL